MPLIQVKLIEGVFDAAEKEAIIEKLTDAMVSVEGDAMQPVTWVTIEEVASGDWASPARPCTQATSSACAPLPSSRAQSHAARWSATGSTAAGDRQLNRALHTIGMIGQRHHQSTKTYPPGAPPRQEPARRPPQAHRCPPSVRAAGA
jgi:4-oxalocrotonate tautomerase